MFGIQFYRADSSTYVIKTVNGRVVKKGPGMNFFYHQAITSIAAIPINARGAPFVFDLKSNDFQVIRVQGQVNFRVTEPEKIAAVMNYNLKQDGQAYVSEDPITLGDQVIRHVQTIIQTEIQNCSLRAALLLGQTLAQTVKRELAQTTSLENLGVEILELSVASIVPSKETSRALEAREREEILKEADDAIYARRKSAVEQERTIKAAELQTELFIQQKNQEIEESRSANKRELLRAEAATAKERLQAEIAEETQRQEFVAISVENKKQEATVEAYAVSSMMAAYKELPVDYIKAMAMSAMKPEQLMALAFESFATHADRIGELNIGPESFGQLLRKEVR